MTEFPQMKPGWSLRKQVIVSIKFSSKLLPITWHYMVRKSLEKMVAFDKDLSNVDAIMPSLY